MKIFALSLVLMVGLAVQAGAGMLWTNPITGANPNQWDFYTNGQSTMSNLNVSGIGRSAGLKGKDAKDRYNATGWDGAAFDPANYFCFLLTPGSDMVLNFTSFTYTGQANKSGPDHFSFRSSMDGFASSLGTPDADGTTISLLGSQFQGLTSAIEFRFYGFGADKNGMFSINDFSFVGSVMPAAPSGPAPVPESGPGLAAFGCVVGLMALARPRRVFARG